jgi:deoxyribodipyrimidine photo-lyase
MTKNLNQISIFWFRRDLRLDDNIGLIKALASSRTVLPIFIFDPTILDDLPRNDARVTFIFQTLQIIRLQLQQKFGSGLALHYGRPLEIFDQLLHLHPIASVYANHDYEPYSRVRDKQVRALLHSHSVEFYTFKDHVLFETDEIVKQDNQPYLVYTPYMHRWKSIRQQTVACFEATEAKWENLVKNLPLQNLTLADIGFTQSSPIVPPFQIDPEFLNNYGATRDFPALAGTSRLGPHLRFGTVSIRKLFYESEHSDAEVFRNELIWREFFSQILWHFPHTSEKSFKPRYDRIEWRNDETEFARWHEGTTGYPLVDAGMRQLNETGYMPNRVRMVVGSFLCKHLLIDWRWGETYFAKKLLDYEMASNVGNWQWVAGCGVDAAPYFRIFNSAAQIKKFDKDERYIQEWVKDLHKPTYPRPIVDHNFARNRCLDIYKRAVSSPGVP